MHELSIAQGIVEAVEKTAVAQHIDRVLSVRAAVGELAGVDIDALRFAWQSVTRDGILRGAALVIETPPGRAWCLDCGKEVPLHRHGEPCPLCGRYHLAATQGHELRVLDFEVPDSKMD